MATPANSMLSEAIRFTESAGTAAGVYSASFELPVGATLIDVIVNGIALWTAGTSATLIVGDTTDDDGFYTAVNLKATDLLAGESISFANTGGKQGADVDATAAGSHIRRRRLTTARTVSAKVTTVGTVGTAGITDVIFVYAYPSPITPAFA